MTNPYDTIQRFEKLALMVKLSIATAAEVEEYHQIRRQICNAIEGKPASDSEQILKAMS